MAKIATFVFFDLETTGLPWEERNQTKITELSFVATLRSDLMCTNYGELPPVTKLSLVFNPTRPINPVAVRMNGLSNELLRHAPIFKQKLNTLFSFLQELPKPVCLVAHNGNRFDFKIFLAECKDANFILPNDLLCLDSLVGFKKIFADNKVTNKEVVKNDITILNLSVEDFITDDEDDWPDLNVSQKDWEDIDKICDSLSDISCEDVTINDTSCEVKKASKVSRKNVIQDVFKEGNKPKSKESFALDALYKRLLNKEAINHHRAEDDCLMLLECVVATKESFMLWADQACVPLTTIKPIVRY